MLFRVRIDPIAQRQIDEFAVSLRAYSEDFAIQQFAELDRVLSTHLAKTPLTWSYFPFTGAPYRAYLFRVGRHIQYWIVYTVDENAWTVDIFSFWNTRRDPEKLEL